MQPASNLYKSVMNRMKRPRGYMSISVGVVNNEAQSSAVFSNNYEYAYWSDLKVPFTNKSPTYKYATFEQNYYRADGTFFILPEETEAVVYSYTAATSKNILGTIGITLQKNYSIRGLTIDFGDAYPSKFKITSVEYEYTYEITDGHFETTDIIGETNYIIITPIEMSGGSQRLRIDNILLGIGLNYLNDDIESCSITEDVSGIAESIPSYTLNLTILDKDKKYNVDNDSSFINFLHTGQDVIASAAIEFDDGSQEWIQMEHLYLSDWRSQSGKMSLTAKDRFSFLEGSYVNANYIGAKNMYDLAEDILQDAGLEYDEYVLDEYLKDLSITAPIQNLKHKECLQLIANASRCKLYQDNYGRICIMANFANVLEPDDATVESDDEAVFSKPENAVFGAEVVYATMEKDFFAADGHQYILPESAPYLATSYVSNEVSNENGTFSENPQFSILLPAAYTYYGVNISFFGNPPAKLKILTYNGNAKVSENTFHDLLASNYLQAEFGYFDKMTFEFIQTYPYNRISVNSTWFGDVSDYTLTRNNMWDNPIGYREETIRDVYVRIFSYENNEQGEPQQVNDDVWYSQEINTTGNPAKFENQLITTQEHAKEICKWISESMLNNVTYDISFRGEPRLSASDIIFMEGENGERIQCEIESHNFTFNKAFDGDLELRKMIVR